MIKILQGDWMDVLKTLPSESVHCCVTSPPYWGLRDYGVPGQLGLEKTPEEYVEKVVAGFREVRRVLRDDGTLWLNLGDSYNGSGGWGGDDTPSALNGSKQTTNCGSHKKIQSRVDGLKPKDLCGIPWRLAFALQQPYYTGTIKDVQDRIWLAAMIDAEGCLFIHKRKAGQSNGQGYERQNDSYSPGLEVANTSEAVVQRCLAIVGKGSICSQSPEQNDRRKQTIYRWNLRTTECRDIVREIYPHLVAKQHQARILCACPSSGPDADASHQSLIALHNGGTPTIDFPAPKTMFEPGWYLRQDLIWKKPNPMPESVTDRCTKAHEYLFLLAKAARYFFDAEAIKEPTTEPDDGRERVYGGRNKGAELREQGIRLSGNTVIGNGSTRNRRSVWTINSEPYPESHFATFPTALVKPCILAGTSAKGCCPKCGAPWERVVERGELVPDNPGYKARGNTRGNDGFVKNAMTPTGSAQGHPNFHYERTTTGWRPTCECGETDTVPCTVLDPFGGSGTTGQVAIELGRKAILIELNAAYVKLAERRTFVTPGLQLA